MLGVVVLLAGCAAQNEGDYATRGLRETDRTVGARTTEPAARATDVAAYVNGVGIASDALMTRLAERAGGAVLQEMVLEHLLTEECARRGISITDDDLARERSLLIDTLRDDGVARDGATREEVLGEVLRRRRLGEAGFAALLKRTAMSRALVRDEVRLSEDAIRRARDLRWGVRYRLRLVTTDTPASAAAARRRLIDGESFTDVASEVSTDASAPAGGRVPLMNPADLSWPAALRRAVVTAPNGEPSAIIGVENGYAVVVVEDRITPPPSGLSPSEERELAQRDARLEAERLLMARLARDLLASSDVDIREPALARAWREAVGP